MGALGELMFNYEKQRISEFSREDLKNFLSILLVVYYNQFPAGNLFVNLDRADCEKIAELLIQLIKKRV